MKRKSSTKTSLSKITSRDEDDINGEEDEEDGAEEEMVVMDDEDDDLGTSNGADGESEPSAKVSKQDKKLAKTPTPAELNSLKEAENLFQSNLFKLQVKELLSEVMLKTKQTQQMQDAVDKLKNLLMSLPSGNTYEIPHQKWLKKSGIKVPFIQCPKETKGEFRFVAPHNMRVVGSFATDTCIKPHAHCDLALELPKECVRAKDFLNQRYLRKRALYLAAVAMHLKGNEMIADMKFSHHQGNHLKPILILLVKGDGGEKVEVHIHVCIPAGSFKFSRLSVDKNNVRKHWYQQLDEAVEESEITATPVYNNTVVQDMLYDMHEECLQKALSEAPGLREGIILLKVWLKRRELDKGYGCFSGFIMSMYVAYLLSCRKLHTFMSSYQVLRNTLVSLASSDWLTSPPTLHTDSSDEQLSPLDTFQQHFDVVFVDPSGYINLCAGVTQALYKRVKHEANLSISFLERSEHSSFETLLLKPVPFSRKFDHYFHICDLEEMENVVSKLGLEDSLIDQGGHITHICLPSLLKLLERALGDRITLIQPALEAPVKWSVTDPPPSPRGNKKISFGLLVDPETYNRIIDRGPPAQSPDAVEFREFWGEKSELRRFQDSSICEAVMWTTSTLASTRRLVCSKVIKYALNRHAGIPVEGVHYICQQLDPLLHLPRPKGDNSQYGTGEEEQMAIIHTFDQLSKLLHKMDDLPLRVKTVQGVAPVFRFAEVFPAMPAIPANIQTINVSAGSAFLPHPDNPAPFYLPTLDVMCQLEGSGKWPEDLEAVRRIKAAFYIELSRSLKHKDQSLYVRVAPDHLDVLKDGYVFRLRLGHTREITLAKTSTSADGTILSQETELSRQLLLEYSAKPKLSSTLHGVNQLYTSYSSTVRMVKRWMASHMMMDHISTEAVELIVSRLFIDPAPYTVPESAITGLLRFLYFLSTFDWKIQPIVINLNNEFGKDDVANILTKFSEDRSAFPLMTLCTPQDPMGSHWTRDLPTVPILQRLILLARESLKTLEEQLQQTFLDTNFKMVFRPPLEIFDYLIYLRWNHVPRHHQAVDISHQACIPKRESEKKWERLIPIVDWDPVQLYLQELRSVFGDIAVFLHDTYGGSVIGVLWKPSCKKVREFELLNVGGCMPDTESQGTGDDIMLKVNLDAVVEDIKVMGEGLVAHIKKNK